MLSSFSSFNVLGAITNIIYNVSIQQYIFILTNANVQGQYKNNLHDLVSIASQALTAVFLYR